MALPSFSLSVESSLSVRAAGSWLFVLPRSVDDDTFVSSLSVLELLFWLMLEDTFLDESPLSVAGSLPFKVRFSCRRAVNSLAAFLGGAILRVVLRQLDQDDVNLYQCCWLLISKW